MSGEDDCVAQSFTEFYRASVGPMVRFAFLVTGGSADAEDLVQDAFANMHPRWDEVEHPAAYLRRSIVNAAASRRRRLALAGRVRPGPTSFVVELGAHELRDAIAALPPRRRAAVVLRYYEDLGDAEIADALGCRIPAVKSLLHRALRDLREVVER
jgi:RNA polymerase sigma-70 factor (sigma-E family)